MAVSVALRPLASAATLRRGVFLVLGGVVAAAYGLLAVGFAQMYQDPTLSRAVVTSLVVLTAAVVLLPPVLHSVRLLETTAARALLDVDLPLEPGRGRGRTRRGAAWFTLHLAAGATATLALLVAVPLAVSLVAWHVGGTALDGTLGPLVQVPAVLAVVLALLLLVSPAYVMWGLGALLRAAAPALLGPSAAERIARLEADKRELAARNALARDLHDSVGHALTVTTLQAAAAERALDRDPEFVRSALTAIAQTGRAAVADLDRVLGVLREDGAPSATEAAVQDRTLAHVPALVEKMRTTDAHVALHLPPEVHGALSPTVSRAGYAIVREALTNALRHGDGTIQVRGEVGDEGAVLTVHNGVRRTPVRQEGRGLRGMRERVELLGGGLHWGLDDAGWCVRAVLPREAS